MAQLKDLIVTGTSRFLGNIYGTLKGNADTATKATQDSAGQQINTTYIKGLSVSGKTITYTKGDGKTGTITTQDTNTTYSNATTSAAGLMSASDKTKLDGITASADSVSFSRSLTSGTKVGTITINGTGTDLYAPTNTDTWRPVVDNLTSTATDSSLSANQGKVLKGLVDGKAASSHTHDDRYYTESEINSKLSGKSDTGHTHSSYVNQNAFSNVVVGSTTVAADSATDTLTLVAGSNVTLTPDATNDKITIAATNTTYSNATTSAAGLMSSSDKSKLDGIAAGANKTTVDSALSSTSTNPVQNKVVNAAINNAVHVDLNGAPAGSAVTNNADTLGGKTLAQIESQISNATTNSTSRTWTVSVPSSGWTKGSLTFMGITCTYKNVVSVAGMTSNVSIDLVKYNSGDVTAARSYICQDTGSGTVTFWAKSALATFSVKLTEVK